MNHPNRNWRRRLEHEAAALGPDLVSAFIQALNGPTKAATYLNGQTGRRATADKLCRWRRGAESVPDWAQDCMRMAVAARLFGDIGPVVAGVMGPPERIDTVAGKV